MEDYKGPSKGGKGGPPGLGSGKPEGGPSKDHDNHQQGIERKEMTNSRDLARFIGIWIPTRMIQWRIALRWIL
jgi:hypothetical protein